MIGRRGEQSSRAGPGVGELCADLAPDLTRAAAVSDRMGGQPPQIDELLVEAGDAILEVQAKDGDADGLECRPKE